MSIEDLRNQVIESISQVNAARKALWEAEDNEKKAYENYATAKCNLASGDIVIYQDKEYFFDSIHPRVRDIDDPKPWIMGRRKKADGGASKKPQHLFSHWQKKTS